MEGALFSPIDSLPEDCVLDVISRTSPRDAYNFSLSATRFRSVVDSDFIWESFLPSDYASILSRAVDPVAFTSKKDLFFKLSNRHVLINGGTMSFGLDRSTGVKCYMLSASLLEIAFAAPPHEYWRQISIPDSRFPQVVEPIAPLQMSIAGKINIASLSPKTKYGAYLVYKLTETSDDIFHKIGKLRQQASVVFGKQVSLSTVYLEPFYDKYVRKLLNEWKLTYEEENEFDNGNERTVKERDDGWIEIELGEFYSDNGEDGEDGEVYMHLEEVSGQYWKGGLIIQGIEIKPKL